jgi:ankyrin repeat protein
LLIGHRFLWVKFQIESIFEECESEYQIRQAIDDLPKTLEETYLRCLRKISKRTEYSPYVLKILKWVLCANRPLHIEELKEAVVFGPEDTKWDGTKIPRDDSRFISSCANLVNLDDIDKCVRVSHRTVKQFLLAPSIGLPESFRFLKDEIQLEIGEGCMTYLSFDNFKSQLATRENAAVRVTNPGTALATLNLIPKLISRFVSSKGPPQITLNLPIRTATDSLPPETFENYRLLDYARSNWLLHTIQISKISPFWNKFEHLALEPNESWKFHPWGSAKTEATHYRALFEWAVRNRHIPLLELTRGLTVGSRLSDLAKKRFENGSLALHYASSQGFLDVAEVLLGVSNVNMVDEEQKTALHWAAGSGQDAVVHLLLEKKAKANFRDKSGRTALILAADCGCEGVVNLLLESGAGVNTKDNGGWTALHWGSERGHKAAAQLLIRNGADADSKDGSSRTPLSRAAGNGHEAVVRLLLEKGADVESKDTYGRRTPLSWAAESGHEAVVRLLLEKGADVESKDSYDRTPLSWAAKNGHGAVAKLLKSRT